jgi:flagellar motor switch protein FliM
VTAAAASAEPGSLLRVPQESMAFPGLERVGLRLARGLKDYLATLGAADLAVECLPLQVATFESWNASQDASLTCQYRLPQMKAAMIAAMPLTMLLALVDLFYGGTGIAKDAAEELTAAEQRFAERIGEDISVIVAAAWSPVLPLQPALNSVSTSHTEAAFAASSDLVVIQSFLLSNQPFDQERVSFLFPLPALRANAALTGEQSRKTESSFDAEWSTRINQAALGVRLPVRTIFARPEISFARLLSLQPGDIIPLLLPQHVPLTVAGRHFAAGSIGEANGRAAIRIEKMKEGPHHE